MGLSLCLCVGRVGLPGGRWSRGWRRHDHDDRREPRRLCRALCRGFGYPCDPPHVQSLIVTPGGKAIVFLAETSNRKHVSRRLDEDLVATLAKLGAVERDEIEVWCRGAVDVVALPAAGIVGREELRRREEREIDRRRIRSAWVGRFGLPAAGAGTAARGDFGAGTVGCRRRALLWRTRPAGKVAAFALRRVTRGG